MPPHWTPAEAGDQGPHSAPAPVAHQISPLSLGVGMALMGLGIGFLGIRLRRR
ncbi:hypothetical protein [Streptomyces sp. PKU-EA00015]|uniref:hypothetical protein n=1 Tax=Streptomyces sp. PKU-EA00015 TaxID=2748326 RepID=UPI00210AB78B|nr:hypothetical protein [Streptomyces sp. PKU-EA00015]